MAGQNDIIVPKKVKPFDYNIDGSKGNLFPTTPVQGVNPSQGMKGISQGGSGFPTSQAISLGTNIASQIALSNIETDFQPNMIPANRRSYKSFAGNYNQDADESYRATIKGMDESGVGKDIAKARALSTNLKRKGDVAFQDAQQREGFENREQGRIDRINQLNTQITNAANLGNMERANQLIAQRDQLNRSFAQEQLDLDAQNKQMNQDTKRMLLQAYSEGDIGTVRRLAKEFGYDDVKEFINYLKDGSV